jgi:hypothetical protein
MTQMSNECRVKVLLINPTDVIASCKLGFGFLLAEVPNMRFMVRGCYNEIGRSYEAVMPARRLESRDA